MYPDLTYNNAVSSVERFLTKGKLAKADIFVTNHQGQRLIVKDFGTKGFWERNLVGRPFIARELRAYRALAGIEGLPSRYKRLSPFAIAIEYLEGKDLGSMWRSEFSPGIIRQFERIVEDLHERGWVHLDLQKRSNILVSNGVLYVVDLASAFHPGSVPILGTCLTRFLSFFDRLSLIKIKNIYAPELMTLKEKKLLRLRNLIMPTKW